MTGVWAKNVIKLGTTIDSCVCKDPNIEEKEIKQCKECRQIYHKRCLQQQREICNCTISNAYVELKKRPSLNTFDFTVEKDSFLPTRNPDSALFKDGDKLENSKPSESSLGSNVKNGNSAEQRLRKVLESYDAKYPLVYRTEIEKQRSKVKRIFFEVLSAAMLHIFEKLDEIKFDFSLSKAEELATYSDSALTDFIVALAQNLESELLKQSGANLAKESSYWKKSRFFAIFFKKEKLNTFLVRLLLGKMSPKELIPLQEKDFSDKKLIESYEAKFWDGREILDESLVLKNHKVDLLGTLGFRKN